MYPPVCPFCGEISPGICKSCRERLPYIVEPRCMRCGKPVKNVEQEYCPDCAKNVFVYIQGRSLWLHTGVVPKAIYQMKFHNKRYYASLFAEEMAVRYGAWMKEKEIEALIPVPLYPSRKRKRGFNQAELLVRELERFTGILACTDAVFRIRRTRPQKELDNKQRERNLRGAFAVNLSVGAFGSVLIVDDIYTTGNTVNKIAELLKKAGVQKVYFLTISIGQGL